MNESVIKGGQLVNELWVEGADDAQLMYHFLKYFHHEKDVKIENKNCIDNIQKILNVALKRDEMSRLGVIVDVDEDLGRRWLSFSALLSHAGYMHIPSTPVPDGTILVQEGLPDIGFWLMPDNQLAGMVEHFVSTLIPSDDVLWPMAGDVVQKVIATKCNFSRVHEMKATIHTWLAWQEEPGKPMGQAITKRYLDVDAPHAQILLTWLRKLFVLNRN